MTAPELGAAPAALQPDDTFQQAARAAMWPQVQRLLELEARLHDADATDELKRYRVATRRLRAAMQVFASALPKRSARDVTPELRDLARAVGRVRDLDVRIGGLLAWAGERGIATTGQVEPLRARWVEERTVAAAELEPRLTGKRHARLLDDLAGLVAAPNADPPAKARRGRARVRDRAGSATWAAFEAVRIAATDIDDADLEALHDLRIRAKRLRYTLEFLAPVLGDDRDWLIARIVGLQDHLGALHDADIAAAATRAFLHDAGEALPPEQRSTIEAFATDREALVAQLRGSTPRAAGRVAGTPFAKRLSQAILGPASGGAAAPKPSARPAPASPTDEG